MARLRGWLDEHQAVVLRRYHGWATLFWMAMVPISFVTGLANLLSYVTALSLWALVSTEWGAWQGSRAEVKVEEQVAVPAECPHCHESLAVAA